MNKITKYEIVGLYFLMGFQISIAQNFILIGDKTFGGNQSELNANITLLDNNRIIVTGSSSTDINGDKTDGLCNPLSSESDVWLLEIDTGFNIFWNKDIGGNSSDQSPHLILGDTSKQMLFSCTSRSDNLCEKSEFCRGIDDYWICKLDSNGNKLWDKTFGGSSIDKSAKIVQLTSGDFIVAGTSNSLVGYDKTVANFGGYDFWIVKLDHNGNKLWDKTYGGSGLEITTVNSGNGFSIIPDLNDNFILAGETNSPVGGNISDSSKGVFDIWIIKLDSSGNKIWDKRYGGSGAEGCEQILKTDYDSGFILLGATNSPISGDITDSPRGLIDIWILKLDSLGNKLWDKRFGGNKNDVGYGINFAPEGGFWVSGWTDSDSSFDVSEQSYGGQDYWILKIDSVGNKLWDKRFGGTGDDFGSNFVIMPDSSIFFCGYADTGTSATKTDFGKGATDYWVVHFKYTDALTGVNENEFQNNNFSIGPNPAINSIDVNFDKPLNQNTPLQIFDLTGRLVYSKQINSNEKKVTIDVSLFSQGTYFVKVNSTVRKIVKM